MQASKKTGGHYPELPPMKEALTLLLLRLLALLPLSVARALGRGCGLLCWWTRRRMARTTETNLALCFPAAPADERRALARDSLQQTFQTICETGAAWLWPAPRTLALIGRVEGLALLQAAKAAGKGVLVVAPHLGNWEIFGLYLNACGCGQSSQLYQPPDSPALDRLIRKARSRAGARMVSTDVKGVAALLKALRDGEVVGILPDQVPPASGGEFAPFFGVPALTMTLLNRLQQRTGAAVLLGYARREGRGFTIVLRTPEPQIESDDLAIALPALNRGIERLVEEVPAQYQWEYKRFKRQPAGTASPYR
jgi:Kdo2-lipid IVA lauroyltransferase/acyltransferase